MGPDDEVKPLQGKMQVEVSPGQWHDVGYVSDLGATSFEVVDEVHQWNAGDLKIAKTLTTSIQIKATNTDLYKLIYGSTAYANEAASAKKLQPYMDQLGLYVQGIANQAAVPHHLIGFDGTKADVVPHEKVNPLHLPPEKGLLPASIDDLPGEFPTVEIAGTPSAAKKQFIDQIGPCDGFKLPLLSKEAAVKISKALKPEKIQLHMNVDTGSMLASLLVIQKKINKSAQKAAQAVHDFAVAAAPVGDPSSNLDRAEQLHRLIPGVDEVVKPPCTCSNIAPMRLWGLIQHLNDFHNPGTWPPDPWSRERIADWLETLDVDLRVQAPPTFEVGDVVHGRISKARGTVKEIWSGGNEIVVHWGDGKTSHVPATNLVAGEPPDLHGYEAIGAGKVTDQLSIGDWVQDISPGYVSDIGQIIWAKKGYDINTDSNVIELKVRYASGGIVFLSPSQVEKVGPPGPGTNPWHSKLIEGPKLSPGQIFDQLNIPMPPLGLGDTVKFYLDLKTEGRVTQYVLDTNTDPHTLTVTVTWPDGSSGAYPREELILVEAYSPPTNEIVDWGGKKPYFNNISPA